jgi:hypothetical protein
MMAAGAGRSVLLGIGLALASVTPGVAAQTVPVLTPVRQSGPPPPRVVVQTLPPRAAPTALPEVTEPETSSPEPRPTETAVVATPTPTALATVVHAPLGVATPPAIIQSTPIPPTATAVSVPVPTAQPVGDGIVGPALIAALTATLVGLFGWLLLRRRAVS